MNQVAALAEALASGTTSARALVDKALARAAADEAAHVFTIRLDDVARCDAENADRQRTLGDPRPLLGIPVTVKDNFDLAGYSTTAGSRLLADAPAAQADAVAVARLRAAGMIVLGRTGMTEFAFSGLGLNPHYGTPANPAFGDKICIPGGSSAGAAVSVALGIVPAAIGTDTGGSVRIPAAFCGLTGFKASQNAIALDGVLPLSTTLDSVGIIARSVADCRTLFDVLRDRPAIARAPRSSLRLGLIRNYVTADLADEVTAAFSAAVTAIATAGGDVVPIDIPAFDDIPTIAPKASFSAVEAFAWHRDYLAAGRDDEYDPRVVARIRPGGNIDGVEYAAMTGRRDKFIAAFAAGAEAFDALIWPTVPVTAPTLAVLNDDAAYHAANLLTLRNSTVANLADGCAISLPCHITGLAPVGLTLAAAGGHDDALLDAAGIVETMINTFEIAQEGGCHGRHQATS
jgi:aspartyl-tRNA(Asn)/glutamyl-tRNA(Gln) amidotransferase subunit A